MNPELGRWIEGRLSKERLRHVEGVAEMARELAERHGAAVERAVWAAWAHDAMKELPAEELRRMAEEMGVPEDLRLGPIVHAPVMGLEAQRVFGAPADVVEAITYHPVARPRLERVGQVLYLADKLEEGRRYDGIEALREAASRDLREGMATTLRSQIAYLEGRGIPPHPLTRRALVHFEGRGAPEPGTGTPGG